MAESWIKIQIKYIQQFNDADERNLRHFRRNVPRVDDRVGKLPGESATYRKSHSTKLGRDVPKFILVILSGDLPVENIEVADGELFFEVLSFFDSTET